MIVDGRIRIRPPDVPGHGGLRQEAYGASAEGTPAGRGTAVTPQEHGLAFFLPRARILLAFNRNHKKTHLRNR